MRFHVLIFSILLWTTPLPPPCNKQTKAVEEISKNEFFRDSQKVVVYPLHSSLSTAEQTAVFRVPEQGIRKIVIATNIAETSITIEGECVMFVKYCLCFLRPSFFT